ncbi:hypothetical protein [Methylobacterium sp. PvR107]|uniref:hypothetical protein n=1 Tax=Methylobacterium sp. PvR107 TaxID=2806597 RepID=UPI001AE62E3A|nr:hypothetical protein [Methylobacterium sp. PvR107]MBP1181599.1 hypothetical protein [Methylobacterium sp. PvR107]
MSALLLRAQRRDLVLFAFAATAIAFGATVLASPPISEAAVAEAGAIRPAASCDWLLPGDVNKCLAQK